MEYISLTFSFWKTIVRETWRGKTLARIFMNHALRKVEVTGNILDLGSSTEGASYNRFLQFKEPFTLTHTDFFKNEENLIQLNLEEPFENIVDETYNTVTCFNTLEHIYNYKNTIRESFRILKSGGFFVGGTPFLVNYHADPHDYFRYTHEALERLFKEEQFHLEKMVSLGYGPFTVGAMYSATIIPKIFRILVILPALLLDWVVLKLKPSHRGKYPLGYVYIFKK